MSTRESHPLTYRPEIDGLRTLAILPVVLFHFGFETFKGGFVGVDIFFVISGFLITSIILKQLTLGEFKLVSFYLNRAKRILPSLFAVCLLSIGAAYSLMGSSEFSAFGESLIYTTLYISNIFFRHSSDYFAPAAESLPLLHTWSLSIEEQFYVFIPAILILIHQRPRSIQRQIFYFLTMSSLLICIWGSYRFPTAAFYLLPTRAWELSIGTLLALHSSQDQTEMKGASNLWGGFGLSMIGLGFVMSDNGKHHPGLMTLLPTLGTAILIAKASSQNAAGRFLSLPWLTWIGKRSYVLYLVHFPILAFSHLYNDSHPQSFSGLYLAVLLISFTELIHRFIELPARRGQEKSNSFWALLFISQLLLLIAGTFIYKNASILIPNTQQQMKISQLFQQKESTPGWNECSNNNVLRPCVGGAIDSKVKIVLFGDSHSFTLFHAFSDELKSRDRQLILFTDGNCPPLLNHQIEDECIKRNISIFNQIKQMDHLEAVVLAARWPWYINGNGFDNGKGGNVAKKNQFLAEFYDDPQQRRGFFQNELEHTFQQLIATNLPIYVINSIPEPGWNVQMKSHALDADVLKLSEIMVFDHVLFDKRNRDFQDILNKFSQLHNFTVINPADYFCDTKQQDVCMTWKNELPLYNDDNHVSGYGAKLIVDDLTQAIFQPTRTVP